MKKMMSVLSALLICLVLCACGEEEKTEVTSQKAEIPQYVTAEPKKQEEKSVEQEKPEETENIREEEPEQPVVSEDTEDIGEEEQPTVPEETEEVTPDEQEENSTDGLRPEFKEAMDQYEAYFTEYCDLMRAYKSDPTNLELLAKYTEFLTSYAETLEKLEALGNDDLNDAELKYYVEVNGRITQMLLEAA